MNSLRVAASAFRESYLTADAGDGAEFSGTDARRLRYGMLWAIYEASVYRGASHAWAQSYRGQMGLYKFIRSVEAPAAQIAHFHQTHLLGGSLDPEAGDGIKAPSCLPILTRNEAIRPAISLLWQWSNWQTRKDVLTLQGSVLGDFAIRVVDDVPRQKVYMRLVHPGSISSLDLDPFGNVKGYTLEEVREDPRTPAKSVVYREMVTRDGNSIIYTTYKDDLEFAWPGNEGPRGTPVSSWEEPYGFVPLVWGRHIDIGLDYGWSEYHTALPVFRELDDIASALDDQIRKQVNAPWLMAGVDKPEPAPTPRRTAATATNPEQARQEVPIFYGPVGAQPHALVLPLDIGGVNERLENLHAKLRRDYPELQADIQTASGDASGRALRVARQRAEAKALARRAAYDDALVRAQQMALAIGGYRGIFQGLGLDSYAGGALDHSIGARPVFAVSELDVIEEDTAFWTAAKAATDAGADLGGWLMKKGWTPQDVARVVKEPPPALRMPQIGAQRVLGVSDGDGDGEMGE